MKLFFSNLKKYKGYLTYAPVSILKTEVSSTYLNWLWWFLDPLFFMLIYTFVAGFIFNQKIEYFPMFVFVGLNTWNLFDHSVRRGVVMMKSYRGIVTKTYVPKYIFMIVQMAVENIKCAIAYLLLVGMMIIYKVPPTWHIIECIPLFIVLNIITFAASTIMLHLGVYFSDMAKLVNVFLRLTFYLTGVFYSIGANKRLSKEHPFVQTMLLKVNPVACLMDGLRNCILYGKSPDWLWVGIWTALGLLFCALGIHLIHRYEAGYAKIS
ncbi:MAG: polysaccharide ABC transporter [Clostridia bacterium]|nr:polysaccharide ABC transporter [Clostridia bacterium]